MTTRRRRKIKRQSRLWRWLKRRVKRYSRRKLREWRDRARTRARKMFGPQVVYRSVADRAFPNPNRPAPLAMRRVDPQMWIAEFEAVFDNGWRVEFQVDTFRPGFTVREHAYEAAVLVHGEPARGRELVELLPLNAVATDVLNRGDR